MFEKLHSLLPNFRREIWILAVGRLLLQIGTGFTLFYAPIFFVNEVGLSATLVGFALGSASISGVIGRFLGGSMADSPAWGRRKTLLLSAAVSAIADIFLALADGFPLLVIGNLFMGFGIGLYWPATEAAVADLTTVANRNEAFAITRLADSLGLGLGVMLGGIWISAVGNYRLLFVLDGVSFLVFFAVIYFAIGSTKKTAKVTHSPVAAWLHAFRDQGLMVYALVNILFTTYISQTQSTLPLYFRNFVTGREGEVGFSPEAIALLFSWHILCMVLFQMPIIRLFARFRNAQILMFSLLIWGVGFVLVWVTGVINSWAIFVAVIALAVFAIAIVSYTPAASAIVVDLAPESLRGVYLSVSSQCWAIGYFIGPTVGGWAMDQSPVVAHSFWLVTAAVMVVGLIILRYLDSLIKVKA